MAFPDVAAAVMSSVVVVAHFDVLRSDNSIEMADQLWKLWRECRVLQMQALCCDKIMCDCSTLSNGVNDACT